MKIKLGLIFIAAGLLIFLIVVGVISSNIPGRLKFIQDARAVLFSQISVARIFVSELGTIRNLSRDNAVLREEIRKLQSQLAIHSELKEQNKFLREALGLEYRPEFEFIDAKTFNLQFTPEGHYMLLNKGADSGIEKGSPVISPAGVLIGQVADADSNFSKVILVSDPDFKTTVRLINNNTSGISRGSLGEGILLDFISQNDPAENGDIVVTSGNDFLPAGLLVGSVSRIEADSGDLFKKVWVKPEFENINISRVLIIK